MRQQRGGVEAALRAIVMTIAGFAPAGADHDPVPGIDPADMDRGVDCYRFANGGWFDRTEIPSNRGSYGTFREVRDRAVARQLDLLGRLAAPPTTPSATTWRRRVAPCRRHPASSSTYRQEHRFFVAAATFWRTEYRDASLTTLVKTDPHSPGMVRAVQPLRNTDAFLDAFDVAPDDPMYLPPEERVVIWYPDRSPPTEVGRKPLPRGRGRGGGGGHGRPLHPSCRHD